MSLSLKLERQSNTDRLKREVFTLYTHINKIPPFFLNNKTIHEKMNLSWTGFKTPDHQLDRIRLPSLKCRAMNIVYFDLETQKGADEVGGWGNKHLMKISFGVTYSSKDDSYKGFEEEDMSALVAELAGADLVIGYNIINFDYAVLSPYTDVNLTKLPTLDLMADLRKVLKFRPKLDNLAQATLQVGKSADGLMALTWFRQKEFAKIALYCKQDVQVTRDLHRFGCDNKFVYYTDKLNRRAKAPVNWST